MRSQLVYCAGLQIANRFLLATIAMRVVRTLHINSARTEDTANEVLAEIAKGRYADAQISELAPLPTIEPLLISPAALSTTPKMLRIFALVESAIAVPSTRRRLNQC